MLSNTPDLLTWNIKRYWNASWCNDFDTHSRTNSKESKLGLSFIIIQDPTRYIASCSSHYFKNHIGQFWNDVICEQPLDIENPHIAHKRISLILYIYSQNMLDRELHEPNKNRCVPCIPSCVNNRYMTPTIFSIL